MSASLLLGVQGETWAQPSSDSDYLPYGVPVPVSQEITRPPEPYAPGKHGKPIPNTRPEKNAVGKPGEKLPVRPARARGAAAASSNAGFPTGAPGSGDRGFWLTGSTGIYVLNDAQLNFSIPTSGIGTTIYAPTHMSAGNACIETVTAHWYYDGMDGTAHGHGFWDWCESDGSGGWQVFEFMDSAWQQAYVRRQQGELRYSTQVYQDGSCWVGTLYNFNLGRWEEKTTICGTGQSGFGTTGWTMWESHYLMDQARICPRLPNIKASQLRVLTSSGWSRPTSATSSNLGPYGLCWENETYSFKVPGNRDDWQAISAR
jgi:hypothetical protein